MSETELAWAAGFFDGEGCSYMLKSTSSGTARRVYSAFRLAVAQVELQPLERFMRALGFGRINGPYQQKKASRRPHYQWCVSGMDAVSAIEAMWPYLSEPKRAQAQVNLELYKAQCDLPRKVNQYG